MLIDLRPFGRTYTLSRSTLPVGQLREALMRGIVPAGIEDHDPQPARAVELAHHGRQRNCLQRRIEMIVELSIDGDQIVDTVDLGAMARVVDHRHVGAGRLASKG